MDPIPESSALLEPENEKSARVYSRTATMPDHIPIKDLIQESMGKHLEGLRGRAPKSPSTEAALQSSLSLVTTNSTTPLESFPLFSKLPTELRDTIWRLAICPRTISLRNSSDQGPGPGVLRAWAESRYITRQMVERIQVRMKFICMDNCDPWNHYYDESRIVFRGPDDIVRVDDAQNCYLHRHYTAYSVAKIGHFASLHNPPRWWAGVRRLMMRIDVGSEQLSFDPPLRISHSWRYLARHAKDVEEVICVFNNCTMGFEWKDLVEVKEGARCQIKVMSTITEGFQIHESTRSWKLTFLEEKNPDW